MASQLTSDYWLWLKKYAAAISSPTSGVSFMCSFYQYLLGGRSFFCFFPESPQDLEGQAGLQTNSPRPTASRGNPAMHISPMRECHDPGPEEAKVHMAVGQNPGTPVKTQKTFKKDYSGVAFPSPKRYPRGFDSKVHMTKGCLAVGVFPKKAGEGFFMACRKLFSCVLGCLRVFYRFSRVS